MSKKYSYFQEVEKRVFQEDPGFFYEDFISGNTYKHWPGRTITESDNIHGSLLFCNQHPLHINNEYGKQTEFGKTIVNSVIVFSIINGMTVTTLSSRCIANLGWDKVELTNPVFVGDTIYSASKVLRKRLSKSRNKQGIVTIETNGYNQNNELIITFQRTFLVPCRENDCFD